MKKNEKLFEIFFAKAQISRTLVLGSFAKSCNSAGCFYIAPYNKPIQKFH